MADMEVHINTEVKEYKESIVLGLTLWQTLCSVLAIGTAVGIYFGFRDILGKETVSWLCLVCAAPFAVAGFFKYNGMTLERFLYEVIYTYLFRSDLLLYKSQNWYYDIYKEGLKLEKHRKDNKIKVKTKKEKA